jgi:dipeptidyl aminopeptidase/acylaminoacyl peptidase
VLQLSSDEPGADTAVRIWAVPLDGSATRLLVTYQRGPRLLTDNDPFDFARQLSPDGRRLVVTDAAEIAGTGLLVIDLVGGTAQKIATPTAADQPAWSPDGRQIAYRGFVASSPSTRESGLWVVDSAGGIPQQVWTSDQTPGAFVTFVFGWADSGSVAVTRDYGTLSVVDVGARTIAKAAGETHGVAVRAKRPVVALALNDQPAPAASGGPRGAPGSVGRPGRVEIRDSALAAPRVAYRYDDVGTLLSGPRWSPVSDELVLHWMCGAGASQRDELVIVDAARGDARTQVVSQCVNSAGWSSDGSKIVYSGLEAVRVRNADGSNDHELFRPVFPVGAKQSIVADVIAFGPR